MSQRILFTHACKSVCLIRRPTVRFITCIIVSVMVRTLDVPPDVRCITLTPDKV